MRGSDRNAELTAVGFSTSRVGFGFERPFTVRVVNAGSLALGAKGVQGGFTSALSGGPRISLGRNDGIVVRAGAEASIFGNRYLWDSLLELPQVQVGYQWLVPHSVADVALKTGYVLLGRHNTGGDGFRSLSGAPEFGAIASLHLGPVDLRAAWSHILARHDGDPIDWFEGAFCGYASSIVLCQTTRYEVGDVNVARGGRLESRHSQVAYLGLTIGVRPRPQKRP